MRPLIFALLIPVLLLSACSKEPGEGGKAEIRGVVMRQEVNGAGQPVGAPYPYQETRVYIIYGDHEYYDDDLRTGPDGKYAFPWLRKGKYTVYTYGERCDGCVDDMIALTAMVEITDKKGTVDIPTFTALNY